MDNIYNADFFKTDCGMDYRNETHWNNFFGGIADKIVEIFNPSTVLDAGCAFGYLVKALREKGVEAYGFDISEYAISMSDSTIKDFVTVHSITEPLPDKFPKKFDLVITIEVLEHLFPEDGQKAIRNLCQYSDLIIFTSTPDDIDNRTHYNVQLSEYWAKLFAENSFYRDLVQQVDFICPWAMLFRKKSEFPEVVFDYELNRRIDRIHCDKEIEAAKENARKEIDDFKKNSELKTATIYFDCGKGLKEDNALKISYSEKFFKTEKIFLPAECSSMRFDPVEGCSCIINNLVIGGSNGALLVQSGNYSREFNGNYCFLTPDPQFFITLPSGTSWVEISCCVVVLENIFLQNYIGALHNSVDTAVEENNTLKNKITDNASRFEEEKTRLIQDSDEKLRKAQSECEQLRAEMTDKLSVLAEEKEKECEQIRNEMEDKLSVLAEEKENECEKLRTEMTDELSALAEEKEKLQSENNHLSAELGHYKEHYQAAIYQRENLKLEIAQCTNQYNMIKNSQFWKITSPARKIFDGIKWLIKKNKFTYLFAKGLVSLKRNGFKITWKKVKYKLSPKFRLRAIANSYEISKEERLKQENTAFSKDITFSILVPLYNTPIKFLEEMIASVVAQTYSKWELCLADGSDEEHSDVHKTVKKLMKNESRIRYKKLKQNLGISENTNECISMSTGDYIVLFDHDDLLHPSALFECMQAICEQDADMIYTDENTFKNKPSDAYCPHFKPDYSPDTLRSYNYICHLTVFEKELLQLIGGGFRKQFDGSQDYDIVLRLTEQAKHIVHIPKILYYWRAHEQSVASDISAKPYTIVAAKKALAEHLSRVGLEGEVCDSSVPSTYRIKYAIKDDPLISIIIPNKDHIDDLKKCLTSIFDKSTYNNYEIIIVENNSTEKSTFEYYDSISSDPRIKVVTWEHEFNYSKINNFGFSFCKGKYILLLNNDIEIITPNWLEEMLMFIQRDDVGAVGIKLYYPDDTIQHGGVIVGLGGVAGHSHKNFNRSSVGYSYRLTLVQNLSCVTAACLMTSRKVFKEIGGLNEKYAVAFNDVDMCMRIRKAGYLIVWTPYAEAYHYESKSRGYEDTPEKQKRFQSEVLRFKSEWEKELAMGDPYYNPNLTLDREDFSLK